MEILTILFWIGVVFVAVAWVLLPFAMFGIKPLLSELIALQRQTNHHIAALQNTAQAATAAASVNTENHKTVELSAPWEK